MSILNNSYLKEQLITYIGNKRRLLPLIYEALKTDQKKEARFLDLFSGSGVVSRPGRLMGYDVIANDWEEYSRILGESHLKLTRQDIPSVFGSTDSLRDLLHQLNHLPPPEREHQYMARYYAPSDTDIHKADFRVERLFYTRENALRIDAIRNYIEVHFPPGVTNDQLKIRNLLIGLLLCEASRHTNTSGVFKAFHKGFGGHGKDALSRILASITLPYPTLPENSKPARIYCRDANQLVNDHRIPDVDIAYMDPPYNQHQYGSNYHILNTIALWDRIPAPLELNSKGTLREKAAIRKDWIKTKSPYCYKKTASGAFSELIEATRARRLLISYSNDGLIPFETMMDICEKKGRLSIISNEYTKYRGGRQSNNRLHSNIEFILAVDTEKKGSAYSRMKIKKLLLLRELALMEKKVYKPELLDLSLNPLADNRYTIAIQNESLVFRLKLHLYISIESSLSHWNITMLKETLTILNKAACKSRDEELDEICRAAVRAEQSDRNKILQEVPRRLKMLAHKKTKEEYHSQLKKLRELSGVIDTSGIDSLIDEIKIQAEKRFNE